MADTFREFIEDLISRHGTAGAIAKACGLTDSAFSRGVKKSGTLGVESLLHLARWSGTPPGRVLRLAGKRDIADLLEQLYDAQGIGPREREMVQVWRDLKPEARDAFSVLLRALGVASTSTTTPAHQKQRKTG